MNQRYTAAEARFCTLVKGMKCLICRRFPDLDTNRHSEAHHIAHGTSRQNNWLIVPLCPEHHRGGSGLHVMQKRFLDVHRVPHGTEYGLLAWLNEDMHELMHGKKRAA